MGIMRVSYLMKIDVEFLRSVISPLHLCIPLLGNIRENSVCVLNIPSERMRIFKINFAALTVCSYHLT